MITKDQETRTNVLKGAEIIYDAVKTTFGPKGRNVLIKDKFGAFSITHDGVTVARAIKLENDPESIGVDLVKEASAKMDEIGDGTTSVTILTYHLIKAAIERVDQGVNPMVIKRELDAYIKPLTEAIKAQAKAVNKTHADVQNIAKISVGGDPKLAKLIADVMEQVGFDGAITVEDTQSLEDESSVVEGYAFEKGYMSPYFITDENARKSILENTAVLVVNGTITDLEDFKGVLDPLLQSGCKSLMIIADKVEADPMNTLILNKVKGVLNTVVVKGPSYDQNRVEQLEDIAILTGGKLIDMSLAGWQDNLTIEYAGVADKTVVSQENTIIIGGKGAEEDVIARVEVLKEQVKDAVDTKEEMLKERIATIEGRVGIIKIGGATDSEIKEKRYRVDDAINAVRAALKGGVVAGGGVTLRDIATELKPIADTQWVLDALTTPFEILLDNSGYNLNADQFKHGEGIDVATGKKVDTLKAGIIDPMIVTCEVVRNSLTTAGLAVTVGGAIVEQKVSQEEMNLIMGARQ